MLKSVLIRLVSEEEPRVEYKSQGPEVKELTGSLIPSILALRRLRQEACLEFKASLCDKVSFRSA